MAADQGKRTAKGPSADRDSSLPAAVGGLDADFPQFQSFAGHNKPPFMVQLLGDYVVSVSATETIVWRVGSPLLNAVADSVPRSCVTLPQPSKGSPASSRFVLADCSLQENQHHRLQAEQAVQPQPQRPPVPHPTQLNQQTPKWEQDSSDLPLQKGLDPSATTGLSNCTSVPLSTGCAPEHILPLAFSDPAEGAVAATNAPAPGATTSSMLGAAESVVSASSPVRAITAQGVPHEGAATKPAIPVDAPACEAALPQSHASDAAKGCTRAAKAQEPKSEQEEKEAKSSANIPGVEVFPGAIGTSAALEANTENARPLVVLQAPQESSAQRRFLARGAAARHVIGTAVAGCRTSCFWRPLKGKWLLCNTSLREGSAVPLLRA